jgi:CheY-like chemotaxis protein
MLATELSVLIVDDFEMSRRVLLDILGKLGVTKILEAVTCREFLYHYQS